MKAPIGKEVYKILKDPKGNKELQEFIGSNKNTTIIELSTGEIYKIMPLRDFEDSRPKKTRFYGDIG